MNLLTSLVSGFVAILIGVSLLPIINQQVNDVVTNSTIMNNSTFGASASSVILKMVPGFFALGILAIAIMTVIRALYDTGIDGMDFENDYDEEIKNNPNSKQTYEEYVDERLRIEKKMKYGWIGRLIG